MGTRNTKRIHLLQTAVTVLALGLVAGACGDDSKEAGPSTPVITAPDGGAGNKPIDAGSLLDATTGVDSAVAVQDGGPPVVVIPGSDCVVANGCYPCAAPKAAVPATAATSERLLNTCSTGCRPFDNKQKLPGFTGTLPPLQ